MRIYTLMMSLLIVALAAAGCSQPEPVRAEYEPADEEVEASVEEHQAVEESDDEVTDRWKAPEAPHEELTLSLTDVEEADEADEADERDESEAQEGDAPETSAEPAEPAKHGGSGVVNLNDASINQLMELPGVGPALAARIVEFRQQRRFEKPDHLLRVRGIGDATFAKLAPMLAVDGPTTLAK